MSKMILRISIAATVFLSTPAICLMKASEQPPPPIRVEITNADQLQRDTVLRVQRDDTGKLTGATAIKV